MKKFICVILVIMALAAVMIACDTNGTKDYEITISNKTEWNDLSKVTLYNLSGEQVASADISSGKASIQIDDGTYIAQLTSVPDTVSYNVPLLTVKNKKYNIEINNSVAGVEGRKSFDILGIIIDDNKFGQNYSVTVCYEPLGEEPGFCLNPVNTDENGSVHCTTFAGRYHITVNLPGNNETKYEGYREITLAERFFVFDCDNLGTVGEHEHNYSWSVTDVATCIADGLRTGTCSICGDTITEKIDKLDHKWIEIDVNEATCTEKGKSFMQCINGCGQTKTEDIPALGHDINTVEKAPTCTEDGKGSGTCKRCGNTFNDLVIPALGHDEVMHEGKDATCEEAGYEPYVTCKRCEYSTYKEIPALNHNMENHNAKAATCTENGNEAYSKCSRCGYSPDYKEVPKLGHDFATDFTIDKEPTLTEDGMKSRHCSRCDAKTEQTVISHTGRDIEMHLANQNGAWLMFTTDADVVNENDTVIMSVKFYYSYLKITLPDNDGKYYLKVKEVPKGYEKEDRYELNQPQMNIVLKTKILDGEAPENTHYNANDIVYDFTVTDINNKTYTLSDLFDNYKLVVINFWKYNCGPCMREFPELEVAYKKYSNDVFLIGIDVDRNDTKETIEKVRQEKGLTFPLARNEECNNILKFFDNGYVPNTVCITNDGIIQSIGSFVSFEYMFKQYTTDYVKTTVNKTVLPPKNTSTCSISIDMKILDHKFIKTSNILRRFDMDKKSRAEKDKRYEERHKAERKAKCLTWGTSVPREKAEQIIDEHCCTETAIARTRSSGTRNVWRELGAASRRIDRHCCTETAIARTRSSETRNVWCEFGCSVTLQ